MNVVLHCYYYVDYWRGRQEDTCYTPDTSNRLSFLLADKTPSIMSPHPPSSAVFLNKRLKTLVPNWYLLPAVACIVCLRPYSSYFNSRFVPWWMHRMPPLWLDDSNGNSNGNYRLLAKRWRSYQHSRYRRCWIVSHPTPQIDCKHQSRSIGVIMKGVPAKDSINDSPLKYNPPHKLIKILLRVPAVLIIFPSAVQSIMPSLKVLCK